MCSAEQVRPKKRIKKVVGKLLKILNSNISIKDEDIHTDDRWLGKGYGIMSPEVLDAIKLLAKTDGILTDPTYSGKSIAGLIELTQQNNIKHNSNILNLHNGRHTKNYANALCIRFILVSTNCKHIISNSHIILQLTSSG